MSRIERDVESLIQPRDGLTLLDGLLIGALVGAAAASLVIVGQMVATRRLARRYGVARGSSPRRPLPPEASPL